MSRLALFTLACALLVSVTFSFASPVSVINGELVNTIKNSQHIGKGTWYYPGLGNCGCTNTSADFVLAISKELIYSNEGSNCYQWVHIVDVNKGKQAYGLTVDSCETCGLHDIEMSPALFKELASLSYGEISVAWNFTSNPFELASS